MSRPERILILVVVALCAMGMIMLMSVSGGAISSRYADPFHLFKRQFVALLLGGAFLLVMRRVDYHHWQNMVKPLMVVTLLLLFLVWCPGVGREINGSRRWLAVPGLGNFQPSELAKFAVVVMISAWMARKQRRAGDLWAGFFIPMGMLGMVLVVILAEPDFGTTVLLSMVGMGIMFAGGTLPAYLITGGVLGLMGFAFLVTQSSVRMARMFAYLDLEKYAQNEGYQLAQALTGLATGGWRGVGLGNSIQKRHYLPEAHTDFIYAIVGEELGLVATLFVAFLFIMFFLCGLRISWRAGDKFGRLLALGITLVLTAQAIINMFVVTGLIPTKGLPLPFISYGGSSMIVSLLMIGVLLSVAGYSRANDFAPGSFWEESAHGK